MPQTMIYQAWDRWFKIEIELFSALESLVVIIIKQNHKCVHCAE